MLIYRNYLILFKIKNVQKSKNIISVFYLVFLIIIDSNVIILIHKFNFIA